MKKSVPKVLKPIKKIASAAKGKLPKRSGMKLSSIAQRIESGSQNMKKARRRK